MDIIFMNYKNSKTLDPHGLLLNLSPKINLKRSDKYIALSNHSIFYTWKNISCTKTITYLLQHRTTGLAI